MSGWLAYSSLFASAFLAATIIPAQSEAGLAFFIAQMPAHLIGLVAIASLGNSLGALVNYGLGFYLTQLQHKRWFPLNAEKLASATRWYQRYGVWSLWLCWVPFIGDPLTVIAGFLRIRLTLFLVIVILAKTIRYSIIAGLMTSFY